MSGGGRLGVVVGGKIMRVDAGFCGLVKMGNDGMTESYLLRQGVFKRNKRNKRNKPMFSGFFAIFEA